MAHLPWDIIVMAIVAAVLGVALYCVLGRKVGAQGDKRENYRIMAHVEKMGRNRASSETAQPPPLPGSVQAEESKTEYVVPSADTELGKSLLKLASHVPDFQGETFLRNMDDMFKKVVTAFAQKDLPVLEETLTPRVLDIFQDALKKREAAHETLHVDVKRMERLEITGVTVLETEDRYSADCKISVTMTSWQTRYTKDEHGKMVEGTVSLTEFRDLWGVSLDGKTWRVAETAVA